ncbi:alpha/beta fold hydrolase [Sphingomonas sp. LHG3406-1]|uniref:alpha/beta hydrolase family protein n=1 Tax=Sphingomonas sp. LHG3406-1 TaxID=2804617 RepID=UPI00260B3341|nr:alpha/beta fold hydrolase [Sphingomonas sp. LHG3406-1]
MNRRIGMLGALLLGAALPVGLAAHAQGAGATKAALPKQPLSEFAKLPQIGSPRLNQNATAIAARMRNGDEQVLTIIPLDQPGAKPEVIARDGTFGKLDNVRVMSWQWIDPDNLLITIMAPTDLNGDRVDATRVLSYNRRTKQRTLLGWDGTFLQGGNVLWMSRSGPPRILLSRLAAGRGTERLGNPEVVEIDVATGRQKVVIPPTRDVTSWAADGEGNVRMGASYNRDNGRTTILYRSGGSGPFRTIIKEKQERYSTLPVPEIFLPGEKALVVSRHEGRNAVYELDLKTMELGRKVFGDAKYDVSGMLSNRDDNALEGVAITRNRSEMMWFDPLLKEIQAVLDETAGGPGMATLVSADESRKNILFHVARPDSQGGYYLFNTATGDTRHLGWLNDVMKNASMNPVRTISYKARDGQTIDAVLTLPRLRPAKALPLIVLPHGGPWARDAERWDLWSQPLAELGYAVVQPNFRGSSGFGKAWEAMSDGNWGMAMQDDLDDSVRHLAAEGIVDAKRVCVMGWSYGGYAAARAAQRNPELYRCAIAGAGVYDIPRMTAYDRNYLGEYGSKYIGSAAGRLADVSPARHADSKWAPILIVHGAKDQRVPVAQARYLVDQLKASGKVDGKDFKYIEQPNNTHNLPFESDRLQWLEEAAKWLAAHNPA